ncbi:hypothetical protein ABTE87_20275, partial [Acinetobacter baumannii]
TLTNFCSSIATCNIVATEMGIPNGWTNDGCVAQSSGNLACPMSRDGSKTTLTLYRYVNTNYDPNASPTEEERTLPYAAVASQIMSDAVA